MKSKTPILLLLFICFLQTNLVLAEDLDYQAILDLNGTKLKEQIIEKGNEFIKLSQIEASPILGSSLVSIKNEFPESIKLIFRYDEDRASLEFYLNAYENIDEVNLNQSIDYKVFVYNVYGQELGYLRNSISGQKIIKISPFLLVKNYNFKKPNIEELGPAAEIIFTEEELQSFSGVAAVPKPKVVDLNLKRAIKIANISDRVVHLDIIEPGAKAIGTGWTIRNDIYEPQLLNFETEPVKLSSSAELRLKPESMGLIVKKAGDLEIDELGNFTWLIKDLSE